MDEVEQVYNYIFEYVKEHETLPSRQLVADATGLTTREMSRVVDTLRDQGRIEGAYLLPTAYHDWWKIHVRARWGYTALRRG